MTFESVSKSECNRILNVLKGIDESYNFKDLLSSEELEQYCRGLVTYKK